MAKIIFNRELDTGIYHIKIAGKYKGAMGQFYMLRGWESHHPVLGRPLSIFDLESESISFIYKVVGEGTHLISRLKESDDIELFGPYGKGFPPPKGRVALIGGGMGIAPLYLAGRELFFDSEIEVVHIYLGFKERAILTDLFEKVSHKLVIVTGGFISQKININDYNYVFACGSEEMMKAVVQQGNYGKTQVFVSLEKRMGCGVGACLSCTCQTAKGNQLTCKDGPVFPGEDIFFE
ncbi:MAG TPA: dihydroorotate dehydrogenase electron transfer subunit [Atribacterota bacterium]|nr:dihydroorotate dehydrogenase electron transfer subunit [Atribacterota bacterium]